MIVGLTVGCIAVGATGYINESSHRVPLVASFP